MTRRSSHLDIGFTRGFISSQAFVDRYGDEGRVDALIIMAPDIDPERLLAHLPATTPAAIVQAATRAEQQRRLTTLGELGRTAATLPPDLPTLLLVGGAMAEANATCDDSLGLLQQAVG